MYLPSEWIQRDSGSLAKFVSTAKVQALQARPEGTVLCTDYRNENKIELKHWPCTKKGVDFAFLGQSDLNRSGKK
jgi:hypothetical protein